MSEANGRDALHEDIRGLYCVTAKHSEQIAEHNKQIARLAEGREARHRELNAAISDLVALDKRQQERVSQVLEGIAQLTVW